MNVISVKRHQIHGYFQVESYVISTQPTINTIINNSLSREGLGIVSVVGPGHLA